MLSREAFVAAFDPHPTHFSFQSKRRGVGGLATGSPASTRGSRIDAPAFRFCSSRYCGVVDVRRPGFEDRLDGVFISVSMTAHETTVVERPVRVVRRSVRERIGYNRISPVRVAFTPGSRGLSQCVPSDPTELGPTPESLLRRSAIGSLASTGRSGRRRNDAAGLRVRYTLRSAVAAHSST